MSEGERTQATHRIAIESTRRTRPGKIVVRVINGPEPGFCHELGVASAKVGRSRVADLRVVHRSLSALHFELRATAEGARLRDLGSTNGTWFHGRRVESITLLPGDEFDAGECRFALVAVEDVVFGRYEGQPAGEILVRGRAKGAVVELPVRFELAQADDLAGVSSVWARSKIDALLGYPNRAADEATKQAVVEVALAHRIMTEFTSFVAVDERRVVNPDGTITTVEQPLPIPEGTTHEGFGVGGLGLVGKGSGGGGSSSYGVGSGVGYGRGGARVRQAKAEVVGSIDKDLIRRIVRSHTNQVRACYETALTKGYPFVLRPN